jgi:hypothetical protein
MHPVTVTMVRFTPARLWFCESDLPTTTLTDPCRLPGLHYCLIHAVCVLRLHQWSSEHLDNYIEPLYSLVVCFDLMVRFSLGCTFQAS